MSSQSGGVKDTDSVVFDGNFPTRVRTSPASQRQHRTFTNMPPMSEEHNPYAKYNGEVGSVDDGINMDMPLDAEDNEDAIYSTIPLPSEMEVYQEFEEYLEAISPITAEEARQLYSLSASEKWKKVQNEKNRTPQLQVSQYVANLRRNVTTKSRIFGKKLLKDGTTPMQHMLRKLKQDLKLAHDSFLLEFIWNAHNGVNLLLSILKEIQQDHANLQTNKKTKPDDFKRYLSEEYECLLCIKFASRLPAGRQKLLEQRAGVESVALALLTPQIKSQQVTIQLLTSLCGMHGGLQQVLVALGSVHLKTGEATRMHTVVDALNSSPYGEMGFKATCIRFFNKMMSNTEIINAKVHLQHELDLAGFDPEPFRKFTLNESPEYEALQRELDIWRDNLVNVTNTAQDKVLLENRNALLRQEVDLLQKKVQTHDKEKVDFEKTKTKLREKCEDYRERAAELQDTVEKLKKLYHDQTGLEAEQEVKSLDNVLKPLDKPSSILHPDKFGTVKSVTSISSVPEPPPVPPPPKNGFHGQALTPKKKVIPRVNLPLLNWTPMFNTRHTIFQDIDDEAIFREVDFTSLENNFELAVKEEKKESKEKRERVIQKFSAMIRFVEVNRSKNMIITKRRTGLSSRDIREAADRCDINALPGEYAELLLKFVPTKDELKQLAHHATQYKNMGEAEQFLFQIAQVDRLESKLSVMAFVPIFDDLVSNLQPNIECVLRASNSVINNSKLKKVFEIILAIGNYMNSCKRGFCRGFKLESLHKLSDLKAKDKRQTLLHYLAELVEKRFASVLHFYDDLEFDVPKGVSFQAMAADVQGLRKGLDLVKFERDKQQGNPALEIFYGSASTRVAEIAEIFKKMEDSYKEACCMFGENHKQTEPDVIFKHLSDFVDAFKKAAKDNYVWSHPEEAFSPTQLKSYSECAESAAALANQRTTVKSDDSSTVSPPRQGNYHKLSKPTAKKTLPMATPDQQRNEMYDEVDNVSHRLQNGDTHRAYHTAPQGALDELPSSHHSPNPFRDVPSENSNSSNWFFKSNHNRSKYDKSNPSESPSEEKICKDSETSKVSKLASSFERLGQRNSGLSQPNMGKRYYHNSIYNGHSTSEEVSYEELDGVSNGSWSRCSKSPNGTLYANAQTPTPDYGSIGSVPTSPPPHGRARLDSELQISEALATLDKVVSDVPGKDESPFEDSTYL